MLKNGTYIADRYEVVGQIGTGGMSDVYNGVTGSHPWQICGNQSTEGRIQRRY